MRKAGSPHSWIPASSRYLSGSFLLVSAYRPIARLAISLAVERAISGHMTGKRISMPWQAPIIWRQRAETVRGSHLRLD
jgi:hypothetical protein